MNTFMDVNGVVRIGSIDVKATPTGMTITTLRVASNKRRKESDKTNWMTVKSFGKQAETIQQHFKKGDLIYLRGEIDVQEWQSKEGQHRTSTEIVLNSFEFIGSKHQDNQPMAVSVSGPEMAKRAVADVDGWDDVPAF